MPYRYTKREGGSSYFYIHNSGHDHKNIFRTSEDAHYFTDKLRQYALQHTQEVKVLAYFLSHDSFHLVVQQKQPEILSKILHKLSVSYAMYFNSKYNASGKLFRGPYKDLQLQSLDAAIVKAVQIQKMPLLLHAHPLHYKWSSLAELTSQANTGWLDTKTYLEYFKIENSKLKLTLNDFMESVPL